MLTRPSLFTVATLISLGSSVWCSCAPEPLGISHKSKPDTATAFLKDSYYTNLARKANTPDGYNVVFANAAASPQAPSYLGYTTLASYDVAGCAKQCDGIHGCESFNIYFERDPAVNPDAPSCANPPSLTNIKCVWWGSQITVAENTNSGQYRGQFQVVISGSNGYTKATTSSSTSTTTTSSSTTTGHTGTTTPTGLPCDIYAAGGTPCVAAHGLTRALYSAYSGPLYQVTRLSDGSTIDISPLSAGGVANAKAQDNFCTSSTCVISKIYDQSGRGNDLTQAPPGGASSGPSGHGDDLAAAYGAPVTLNGSKAYGLFSSPGTGYRNDDTEGMATGNAAQGIYVVLDGTHYNGNCCFDYGNAETDNHAGADGTMNSLYFGEAYGYSQGARSGPWIQADFENGLFGGSDPSSDPNDPTISNRFVTAIQKGDTTNNWAIRGGNGQSGSLSTFYNGVRPNGYYPMQQQGAIILGIGGDNSDGAQGTFYEGAILQGFPSDATDNSVQSNVVSAGYQTTSLTSGPAFTVGNSVSFRVTTPGFNTRYIAHNGSQVITEVVTSSSPQALQQQASFTTRTGLGQSQCYSFESVDTPGSFLRHYGFELYLESNDGSKQFGEDATFCPQSALSGQGSTIRSWSYPTRNFRHYYNVLYIATQGGYQSFDNANSYANDVSFVVSKGFASS